MLTTLRRVIDAAPEVYNHNTETVPRLYRTVRGVRSHYPWTLAMFRRIAERNPAIKIKSGLMLVEDVSFMLKAKLWGGADSDLGWIFAAGSSCIATYPEPPRTCYGFCVSTDRLL